MFNAEEFNAHLNEIGQDVLWRRAHACPCVSPHSGHASPACQHCTGSGRLWKRPVEARTGVAGGNVHKQWLTTGLAAAGDVIVSVPSDSPLYKVGPYDRVLFLNRTEPFSQNIVKGVNEQISFAVVELESVLYLQDGELVDAELPMVLPDGSINWSGVELPDGVTFSLAGRRRAEYYCFPESPFDRPHNVGAALPRRVVLRRFDLYANQYANV